MRKMPRSFPEISLMYIMTCSISHITSDEPIIDILFLIQGEGS